MSGLGAHAADEAHRSQHDYISVYDIQRTVVDGATVPIYYESRLAKLEVKESERPRIDPEFEEATEGEEVQRKEKLKSRWAQLETVRKNVKIDWTVRENVRAQLRVLVKRILRKHGYPPDKQEKATQTVLEQAEVLCGEWAA